MNCGRDLHRQNTPLTEETVLLAHQLEAYRADSQPWTDQLTDDTLALIHCICWNYKLQFATRRSTTSVAALIEQNLHINKLHSLFVNLTSAPAYINGAKAYIESLSVRTIGRSLGLKTNKPHSQLVISFSSSSFFVNASRNDQAALSTEVSSTETNQPLPEARQSSSGTSQPSSRPSPSPKDRPTPEGRSLSESASPASTLLGLTESISCGYASDVAALLFLPKINATLANEAMANPQAHLTADSSNAGAFSRAQQKVLDSMFNQILRRLDRQGNGTSTPQETPSPAVVQTTPAKTYYRDIFSFTTRLRVAAQTRDSSIICHDIALCLKGSVNTWWTMELDDVTRCGLINHPDGVQAICDKLEKRFRQALSRALAKFEWMIYTVQDAQCGRSVAAYAAELVAQAKQCGFADSSDILVLQIWRYLDLLLRLNIDELSPETSVEAFIQLLTQKESNWADRAQLYQRFPSRYGNPNQEPRYSQEPRYGNLNQEPRYGSSGNNNASQDSATNLLSLTQVQKLLPSAAANFEDPRRSGIQRSQYLNNATGTNANPRRPNYPYRNNANQYSSSNVSPPNTRNQAPSLQDIRQNSRAYHGDADTQDNVSTPSLEEQEAYQQEVCNAFQELLINDSKPLLVGVDDELLEDQAAEDQAAELISDCFVCHAQFPSNTQLHRHIQDCHDMTDYADIYHIEETVEIVDSERTSPPSDAAMTFRDWCYVTSKAYIKDPKKASEICLDSGCTMTVVDEEWLKTQLLDVVIKRTPPISIRGVGQDMSDRAVVILLHFSAILSSGRHVIMRLKIEAHLLSRLKANLLLGIDNMAPEGISLDISGRKAVFTHCQDAQAVITVCLKRHYQSARAVFALMRVSLPPHSAARVPIRLKSEQNLPNDRDYLFESGRNDITTHIHAIDATLSYIHIENMTNKEVVISRRAKLGFLREYDHADI
ncbi:hypothetical protein AJ78_08038 [Emergomyces pasteurianus Ep9510]|uniref:C2H2-type domain-containing protein n=1 Tax=Emergomyces pasteurianus Ep9510 TaxID=1447872 RepID=A0A1J9P4Q3_9EURO|nr:hypothetical protein AJ78_08038 [Emergomyces pasteurianus Ep9510]